jgi:hypothetical protein
MYTITIKSSVDKTFCLSCAGKVLSAFAMVNMANHVILVVVCCCLLIKLN